MGSCESVVYEGEGERPSSAGCKLHIAFQHSDLLTTIDEATKYHRNKTRWVGIVHVHVYHYV